MNQISIKIPEERIGVIIGKNKKTKELLEKELNVKIKIDGNTIYIEGEEPNPYFAEPVIKAIGRGFNPQTALLLKNPEYQLYIINLYDYYNTENAIVRIKGRVIGKKGTIKQQIEKATDSYISVYGHTIAIIAPYYSLEAVVKVIDMIVRGAKHSTALSYLSRLKGELFYKKLKGGIGGQI